MSANVHRTAQTERKRPWLCFGIAFSLIFFAFFLVLSVTTPLLDPIRRHFSSPVSFPIAEGALAVSGDRLVCAGENALWLYASDGTGTEYPADFSAPRFRSDGKQLLGFDADGTTYARLSEGDEPVLSDAEGTLFDADVAERGEYALLLDTVDYRAVLEVRDAEGALRFRHRSKTAFLNNCALSPDASLVAATALGQREAEFESRLLLFSCDSDGEPTAWTLEDVPYACGFLSESTLFVFGSAGVSVYRTDGALLQSLPEARLLAAGDGLLLADEDGTVQVLDVDGTLRAAASADGEPIGGALCGEYLVLQFDDSLRVFTRDLLPCGQTDGAAAFSLCSDGTVWCSNDLTVTRYIP